MFSLRDLEWSSSQKVAMEEVSRMGVDDDDGGGSRGVESRKRFNSNHYRGATTQPARGQQNKIK